MAKKRPKLTDQEKADKKFKSDLKAFIIATLRIASFRWKPRQEAKSAARVQRGIYMCAMCSSEIKPDEIKIDHVNPVIPIDTGFTTWDSYIERMFCKSSDFQILCTVCHDAKTFMEKEMRKVYRKKRANDIDSEDEE